MGAFDNLRSSSSEEEEEEAVSLKAEQVKPAPVHVLDASWKTQTATRSSSNKKDQTCMICQMKGTTSNTCDLPCDNCLGASATKQRVHKSCIAPLNNCPRCKIALSRPTPNTSMDLAEDAAQDLFAPGKEFNRNKKSNNLRSVRQREYATQKRDAQREASKDTSYFEEED